MSAAYILSTTTDCMNRNIAAVYDLRNCCCQSNVLIATGLMNRDIGWTTRPARRSQWPPCLRRGSAAVRLLGLWIRSPPGACMSVSCECCVLPGRVLCVGLITRAEESYRIWCLECDHEASIMRRPWPTWGCCAIKEYAQVELSNYKLNIHGFDQSRNRSYFLFAFEERKTKKKKDVSQKLAAATKCIKSLRQLWYSLTRRNETANEKSSYSDRGVLPFAQTFQSSSRLPLFGLPFLLRDRTKGNEFSEWALLFIFIHCSSTRRHGLAKITPASQLGAPYIYIYITLSTNI
jgi:hypothetical protein